jgi:hypothetical protein
MKNYLKLQNSFFLMALFLVFSCTSDDTETNTVDSSDIESTELSTRGTAAKVSSKAYHFKNMAVFENGISVLPITDLDHIKNNAINFVVLYDASTPWAAVFSTGNYATTGNDVFNALMDSYQLEIIEQFEIDEENEAIVLDPIQTIDQPLEAARALSLVEGVLMVQLKEVPANKETSTTAVND